MVEQKNVRKKVRINVRKESSIKFLNKMLQIKIRKNVRTKKCSKKNVQTKSSIKCSNKMLQKVRQNV